MTIQDATAQECTALRLENGEQLPTLQQYLEKAVGLNTRLILELKAHRTPEQETRAVEGIEWIKECHNLGMKVNVWTVNERKDMEWLISQGVDFITTDEPVMLEEILKKK